MEGELDMGWNLPTRLFSTARPSRRRAAFTLIELLVVVSIIGVLIAMVLPALGAARERATVLICQSNLKQAGIALSAYAVEHRNVLMPGNPDPSYASSCYRLQGQYDMRPLIKEYIKSFEVWKCPSVGDAANLDDPGNTRTAVYATYSYFPGRATPDFGYGGPVPLKLAAVLNPSARPMMQDNYEDTVGNVKRFNHGTGELQAFASGNPSFLAITGDEGDGLHALFFDGHVTWHHAEDLVDVGRVLIGQSWRLYSVDIIN